MSFMIAVRAKTKEYHPFISDVEVLLLRLKVESVVLHVRPKLPKLFVTLRLQHRSYRLPCVLTHEPYAVNIPSTIRNACR